MFKENYTNYGLNLNLGQGVHDFFEGSSSEISYANLRLEPLCFQDDVARVCKSLQAAQAGCDKMAAVTNLKQLDINVEKSSFILLGNKSRISEIRDEIKLTSLTFRGETIKEKNYEQYLGDYIHSDGLSASVTQTINARHWRLLSAVLEIKTIIEDYRINTVGGILTGKELWDLAVIPVMLTNAGTWTEITEDSLNKLNIII